MENGSISTKQHFFKFQNKVNIFAIGGIYHNVPSLIRLMERQWPSNTYFLSADAVSVYALMAVVAILVALPSA